MHGVTGSSFSGSSTRKVWLWIKFLISFWVAFSQVFFILSDIFFTLAKFLGSGMKWETSKPDSPKSGKSYEIFFTTVLNTLYKPVPTFLVDINNPFQSDCICIMRSRILWRASLWWLSRWDWLLSRMSYNISTDML